MVDPGMGRTAIIIGAGPAGLTAAFELLERSDLTPVVLERDPVVGGIARTVVYRGNRMDIGGHRFFSKSERVMRFWFRFLPLEAGRDGARVGYQRQSLSLEGVPEAAAGDERVMLVRPRRSRIFFDGRFFEYPLKLSRDTISNLGPVRMARIGLSYARAFFFPSREERNLEEFFVNRFGRELYETFFKSYTEKVWGAPCETISAEWGRQRVKGLSIAKALAHLVGRGATETSLIEEFLYPRLGPGQLWEEVAREVVERGGKIVRHQEVERVRTSGTRVTAVVARDQRTGERTEYAGDEVFTTMAVKDLVAAADPTPPEDVRAVADGLVYRDFIAVGMLYTRLAIGRVEPRAPHCPEDNWIYIHDPAVKVGRLQIFNNWSPDMVADPDTVWLGLEYFCEAGDGLWSSTDEQLVALARDELARLKLACEADYRDATVVRMPKSYPAYFGTYARFGEVRRWMDGFENLWAVGRNGMHRYNNQDHSMLTAMIAVDNIVAGRTDKANLWDVNTDQDHHEER